MHKLNLLIGWLMPALYLSFPLVMGLSNIVLLLILILFIITFTSKYFKTESWNWPGVCLISLYCVVLIGAIYSPASWEWISVNLGKYTKFIYSVILMMLFLRFPEYQKRSMVAFAIAMFFIVCSTWLNVWFILPWSETKTPGWGLTHHVFGDYITQNVMVTFFVVFLLSKLQQPWLSKSNFFWGFLALMSVISITHLSQGRTGLLLLFAGLISFILVRWGWSKIWISFPIVILLIFAMLTSSEVMRERIAGGWKEFLSRDVDVMSSIGHRAYNYRTVPKMIAEKPIFGHGTGAYHTEICRFLDKPEWCEIFRWHPHNQFLYFGADHGLLGIFLYCALLFSLYRTASKSKNSEAKLLLFSLISILIADSMINSPLFSSRESHFFLYLMALLVPMCQSLNRENNEQMIK
jgi:O-antigen ligase